MIANSGVIAPLPYSHGSGLTQFLPNNEVFLGRFLPFFAHCVVGFCWPMLLWRVWRQWCGSIASQPVVRRRVGMGGGWRGQSENTEADTWQETVIIWLEDHRRSSSFVDWLQRNWFSCTSLSFYIILYCFLFRFWGCNFNCHMLPPTWWFFT